VPEHVTLSRIENPGSIWIMGLSAAGKSTLAGLLSERLRQEGYPCMLLDGEEVRRIFDEKLGYDEASRRKQTQRIVRLTRWISDQGILPVVAIIHPFEDDRADCRATLDGYFEVYLKCPLEACVLRDAKNVYQPAIDGTAKDVVGIDIPYDPPTQSDLVLESDKLSPGELLDILWEWVKTELLPGYQVRLIEA
jgi:adenylyl-sulfate kinase